MNNNEQIQNVKKALELSQAISDRQNQLLSVKKEKFKPVPDEPKKETFKSIYPEIKSTVKINWWLFLLPTVIFLPWPIIYYFIYKNKKDADIANIKLSADYQNQCREIDRQTAEKQRLYDEKYAADKKKYDEVIIPQYNSEYQEWADNKEQEQAALESELSNLKTGLEKHYSETKIVPLQYRSIDTLQYLYDTVSTSDYSIREAIDIFDRNEQRKLDELRLEEQQKSNELTNEQNQLAYEQNLLLDRQNSIAEKARREANAAAVTGAIQRHNTNKSLKKISKW